jgi:hypothetical protein
VNPTLNANGMLASENAAESAGVAGAGSRYELVWSAFDNAADADVGPTEKIEANAPTSQAPAGILSNSTFVSLTIRTTHPDFPAWRHPTKVHFRRSPDGWDTVGIDRDTGAPIP